MIKWLRFDSASVRSMRWIRSQIQNNLLGSGLSLSRSLSLGRRICQCVFTMRQCMMCDVSSFTAYLLSFNMTSTAAVPKLYEQFSFLVFGRYWFWHDQNRRVNHQLREWFELHWHTFCIRCERNIWFPMSTKPSRNSPDPCIWFLVTKVTLMSHAKNIGHCRT